MIRATAVAAAVIAVAAHERANFSEGAPGGAPEQLWINFGSTPDSMVIGWLTANMSAASVVEYGTASGVYTNSATGNATFYVYGPKYTSGLIHHVRLSGLSPNTQYFYRAGSAAVPGWSAEYSFMSNPGVGPIYPYTLGFVGDIGENDDANATVSHLLANPRINSLVISGDIAYASGCESMGCTVWDAFQRMAQPLAATKPWAVNLGNHETYDNANGIVAISARYRFHGMPFPVGSPDDIWYFSYEVGPVHLISISSFYPGGFGPSSPLTTWLKADLAKVDRAVTPWLLVSLHAPWYNSNTEHQGDGEAMRVALEPVLVAAGVNAIFPGHVHSYERTNPVNNNQVVPAGQGIVHFNIGDAGASLYTKWISPQPGWSAFRSAMFGHGEFELLNNTHGHFTWHKNSEGEPVISDEYYVINQSA